MSDLDTSPWTVHNKRMKIYWSKDFLNRKAKNGESGVRQEPLSSENVVKKSATTWKRRAPAGLQQGERCNLKPIWPAFSSVSPGQYEVNFSKDGMDLFQKYLTQDIADLLEDFRIMKSDEVSSNLKAKEAVSDDVGSKNRWK